MLVEVKKLNIINNGYRREVSISKVFINVDHIISISDHSNIKQFLINEANGNLSDKNFSLLKISNVNSTEEMIVVGTSEEIFKSTQSSDEKGILHG